MWTVIRHLFAIAVLPFTVTLVIPIWIARRYEVTFLPPTSAGGIALVATGIGVTIAGLVLFVDCLTRFAIEGRGTLAPWDPPKRLVVRGAYRYVRNPMIAGVILVLCGESLIMRSVPHALWAATFLIVNYIYIPLLEEPQLEERFGDEYRQYRRHVRRFLPRLRPWRN